MRPEREADRARFARALAVALFAVAALLTVKTALDLVHYRRQFPGWFVPMFVFGTAVLIGYLAVGQPVYFDPLPSNAGRPRRSVAR